VAFLVLFPMAYTDVNDVWKLKHRRQRLAVGSAGIVTELMIAVWASALWCLLPDGVVRNMAFMLATTTWISTVIINASPFLRFDGYFLLMDWLDLPNLHGRAFGMGRWKLRQWLFATKEAPPEAYAPKLRLFLISFAFATWVYRAVVFLGIAVLVYYAFPKPLGPILGAVELMWFIWMPLWREMKSWSEYLPSAIVNRRMLWRLGIVLLMMAILFIPWDSRVSSQGILEPANRYPVVVPEGAQLQQLEIEEGAKVSQGDTLLALYAPAMALKITENTLQQAIAKWQWQSGSFNDEARQQQLLSAANREKLLVQANTIEREQAQLNPVAPIAGQWMLADPELHAGQWLQEKSLLGEVVDASTWQVTTYLTEQQLQRVAVGDKGSFYSDAPGRAVVNLQVINIDRDVIEFLPDGMLASVAGGNIPVRQGEDNTLVPDQSLYRVELSVIDNYASERPQSLRGQVVIKGDREAYLSEFVVSALALFYREAGF